METSKDLLITSPGTPNNIERKDRFAFLINVTTYLFHDFQLILNYSIHMAFTTYQKIHISNALTGSSDM